jgi:hypothetical protein
MIEKNMPIERLNQLMEALKQYDQVLIGIHDTRTRPQSKLDYSSDVIKFITGIAQHKNTVTCVFANPYTIATIPGIEKSGILIACYQMSDALQRSAVKVITGQMKTSGKLPVRVNGLFVNGMGIGL